MISLANAGAQWREPKSVAVTAARIVIAESAPDVFQVLTSAEAAPYGGAALELVETAPGSGVFELAQVGLTASDVARLTGVALGNTIRMI